LKTETSVADVELIGRNDPRFDEWIKALWGRGTDDVLLPALPYSVIAHNNSSLTVALLGVRFDMRSRTGKPYSVVHYADSLRYPENADLIPGGARFICAEPLYTALVLRRESGVDPRGPMNLGNLRKALSIAASIDCVAFDNGYFTGPDSLGAFDRLARERSSEEDLLASVLASASPERLLDDAMEEPGLRALARRLREAFAAGGRPELEFVASRHRCRVSLWK
jgi:hypothetical protein